MDEEINRLQEEVAPLTTIKKNVKLSVGENNRLKMELNLRSDRTRDEHSYLGKCR